MLALAGMASANLTKNLAGGYSVDMRLNPRDDSEVLITIVMDRGSWVGLGLGTSNMTGGSDMIQVDSGNREVLDRTSIGNGEP